MTTGSLSGAMEAARLMFVVDQKLLSEFRDIHCSAFRDPEREQYLFDLVSSKAVNVDVYTDPTLAPGVIEFRARDGSILVAIQRSKKGRYNAYRAPSFNIAEYFFMKESR